MSNITKSILFLGYLAASVSGLAILRQFLPRVTLSLRHLPPVEMRFWLLLGGGLYILSFGLWLLILRAVPLVIAYPVAVGLTICGTTAIGIMLLGEHLHMTQGVGILLVILGVVCIFTGN